jgi:hypothetical protein
MMATPYIIKYEPTAPAAMNRTRNNFAMAGLLVTAAWSPAGDPHCFTTLPHATSYAAGSLHETVVSKADVLLDRLVVGAPI